MLENLLGGTLDVPTITGQQMAKFLASDGGANSYFGEAAVISGNGMVCILGAPNKVSNTGTAYVFKTTDGVVWTQVAKLQDADPAQNRYFGCSVAVSDDGTICVIGKRRDSEKASYAGAAYIFKNTTGNTWSQVAKLTANDAAADDYYGTAVAMSGNGQYCTCGSPRDDDSGSSSGSAYVYKNTTGNTWEQVGKLKASDGVASIEFGNVCSMNYDGSICVVGNASAVAANRPVYVFKSDANSSWAQSSKLVPLGSAVGDKFGTAVVISRDGSTIAIGANGASNGAVATGAVHIFKYFDNTWTQSVRFVPSEGAALDYFGGSVGLSRDGSICVVGAYGDDDKGSSSGSVYVYQLGGETANQILKIVASDGAANCYLGMVVSMANDGSTILAAAKGHNTTVGSAYIFK